MMGAGLWWVDLTCTLDTGGVVGGGVDEHRPPPHRTSYLVSGLAGGLGRGWLLAMGGTPSTLQRVGWMWMKVCLWAVCACVCVCVFIKKKKQKKLLYKDFMADFICVHFCPRRCRKAVKCINRVWMTSDFKILTKKKRRAWELNIRALLCYHFPKLLIKAWRQD